jgi:hypothetical protein
MVFSPPNNSGMISSCENTAASMTPIGFRASIRIQPSEGSSATPRPASSVLRGGGKDSLRRLRHGSPELLRSQGPPRSGSLLRRHAGVPEDRGSAGAVPKVREGEAGVSGVPLRQPLLHEAVLLLRGPTMPLLQRQGHRQGTASRLAHGQGAGEAVHAGAAEANRHPGAQDHRDRRGIDPQGAHLPDHRKRPGPEAADLVRGGTRTAGTLPWTPSTHGWDPKKARESIWP